VRKIHSDALPLAEATAHDHSNAVELFETQPEDGMISVHALRGKMILILIQLLLIFPPTFFPAEVRTLQ